MKGGGKLRRKTRSLDVYEHLIYEMSSNLGFFFVVLKAGDEETASEFGMFSRVQAHVGGIFGTPCFCSSTRTLSVAGGFSPRGSGSHGFDKTSPIAASTLSFVCCKTCCHESLDSQ
jgi:hypothetical protein